MGIEGYKKLRRLLRHSRLDGHVDQTRYGMIQILEGENFGKNSSRQKLANNILANAQNCQGT